MIFAIFCVCVCVCAHRCHAAVCLPNDDDDDLEELIIVLFLTLLNVQDVCTYTNIQTHLKEDANLVLLITYLFNDLDTHKGIQ